MITTSSNVWSFEVQCPHVDQVYLVGEFNNWSKIATPMKEFRPGVWRASLELAPGTYRFRYYVPAQSRWITDYAAFGITVNEIGGYDSVVYVPQENGRLPDREAFPSADSITA